MELHDYKSNDPIAWCPGCGNFGILSALKKALVKLDQSPKDTLLVSGIGQAAKLPHYIKANCFNGLHGRALPVAAAAKIVRPELTVIVSTGDGDCYGEGGNHFIHNIRRNTDITVIVHNNQIYGLTKGQASPTSDQGHVTKVQPQGVSHKKFNSLAIALAAGGGFVARGFSQDVEHLTGLIVEAVNYKGFSLVEVLQPCVSFNKINTYNWYSERVYNLQDEDSYRPDDIPTALVKAMEWSDTIPLGIIYRSEEKSLPEKETQKESLLDSTNNDIREIFEDFT